MTTEPDRLEVMQADRDAANKALDIAFRGDTSSIDEDMAQLFAFHRTCACGGDADQPGEGSGEPRVIVRAAKCGHHFNADCDSCQSALEWTNRQLDDLRSQSITPPEVGGELVERVARALYACEKARSDRCDAVISAAKGKTITVGMEPWEDCWQSFYDDARAVIAALSTPEVVDGPSGVWSKAVYAAADKARNDALAIDPNDQMSALAVAVDAALACEASDAKGLVEALEGVLNIAECWEIIDGGKNINLAASEAVIRARTALSQHRGVS